MKQDSSIQKNVIDALHHVPSLNAAEIGVSVKNGIVTLTGMVNSYPKKIAAERAAWQVAYVKGMAIDIEVNLNGKEKKSDSEIAQAAMNALHWNSGLDTTNIKIMVEEGSVTLEGTVDWDYQRRMATKALANIISVKEVINNLRISEKPVPAQLKEMVIAAIQRNSNIHSKTIEVDTSGSTVKLRGKVSSWLERKEVLHTVWSLQGVRVVDNDLIIEHL